MKGNKGITMVALVVTLVIMSILLSVSVQFGKKQIERAKLEDIKTTMLLIKGRAKIIADKEEYGENYDRTGMIGLAEAEEYDLGAIQPILNNISDTSSIYIWEQVAMDNNSIDAKVNNKEFFIIDYATGEVYYSLGYTYEGNTYYSLTQMQNL